MSAVQVPQSTSRRVMLKVFLTGTSTPATGKTLAIVISKAGGAFANPSAGATNATEVAFGWYYVDPSTTDFGTLGDLVVRGTASGCDDAERLFAVVKATNAGLTGVPDAAAGANAGLPVLSVSGTTLAYTVSTLTTYTGNTVQTGDSFTRIGTNGAGLSAVALSASGLDAIVVESGMNARQGLSVAVAALAGVLSGAATTSIIIKGGGVATTRITATTDSSGNRSAITLNLPS